MKINPKQVIAAVLGWSILITLTLISLLSCGPAKRLERLHKNNPYLFVNIKDTITIKDTIIVKIPGTVMDTAFDIKYLTDTIILEKEGVRTVIYRKQGTDTVYVNTTVREKTIQVPYKKDVVVDRYQYNEMHDKALSKMKAFLFSLLAFIAVYILWDIWRFKTKQ